MIRNVCIVLWLVLGIPMELQATAGDRKSLTLAYGLENYDFSPLFKRFEQQTGIKVNVTAFKNNELKSELIQRANIEQLPDAVIVPSDFAGLKIIDVSQIPDDLLSEELEDVALGSSKVNGVSRGIPIIFGNHLVLYYNKSFISEPATNWESLLAQKETLSGNTSLIGWNYMEMYWLIPFLGAFDSFPFLNNQVMLNTPGMVQALQWYRSFLDKKLVEQNCDHDCSMEKFKNRRLAYLINGTWAFRALSEELGSDLGVALLPDLQNQKMKTYFSSHLLAFPDNGLEGVKKERLIKLAKFMQSQEAQKMIWSELKSIPTNRFVLNTLKSSSNKNVANMLKQLNFAEPMPNEHNMAIIWEAMLKGFNRYLAGVFNAQSAAEYMQYVAKKSIEHVEEK